MTNLEQAIAGMLESIEIAKNAGDSLALSALLQRKGTICAALAAPEHSLHSPHAQKPNAAGRHFEREERFSAPLLAESCV
jgi:hypothetical protein